jgi:hypothetical protein
MGLYKKDSEVDIINESHVSVSEERLLVNYEFFKNISGLQKCVSFDKTDMVTNTDNFSVWFYFIGTFPTYYDTLHGII